MTGVLEVLNAGLGDVKITFAGKESSEIENDLRMMRDMMKQGYVILVEMPDGTYKRARGVNEKHQTYVIQTTPNPKDKAKASAEVPVRTARATSVGRSAGGPAARTPLELLRAAGHLR